MPPEGEDADIDQDSASFLGGYADGNAIENKTSVA